MQMETTACSLLIAFLTALAFLYRLSRLRQSLSPKDTTSPSISISTTIKASSTIDPQQGQPHCSDSVSVTKEPDFPANWLTGSPVLDLERRALFSKKWLPLSHTAHFPSLGSYQTLTIASFPLILIRGKDSLIRGFHNVCRHRAYPLTSRESGCSTVLRCRYHGWSYNARGQLVSAPHFGDVGGFEKGENGLFEIGVWVDTVSGVLWGCLEVRGEGEEMDARGKSEREEMEMVTAHGIRAGCLWVGGSTAEGRFNWKVGLSKTRLMTLLGLDQQKQEVSYIQRLRNLNPFQQQQPADSTHLFPNTFIYMIRDAQCWLIIRFLPTTEDKSGIRYDLYSFTDANERTTQTLLMGMEEKVKGIIRDLEAEYQMLIAGDTGSMLSALGAETAESQSRILSLLQAHAKLERAQGAEIYPARREPRMNKQYEQAEQLCRDLDCGDGGEKGSLAW